MAMPSIVERETFGDTMKSFAKVFNLENKFGDHVKTTRVQNLEEITLYFTSENDIAKWVSAASVAKETVDMQSARMRHLWHALQPFVTQKQQLLPSASADLDAPSRRQTCAEQEQRSGLGAKRCVLPKLVRPMH